MTKYTTEYGGEFDSRSQAQSYANGVAAERAATAARARERIENFKAIMNAYNNGDWDEVIKLKDSYINLDTGRLNNALLAVAYAKKGNYEDSIERLLLIRKDPYDKQSIREQIDTFSSFALEIIKSDLKEDFTAYFISVFEKKVVNTYNLPKYDLESRIAGIECYTRHMQRITGKKFTAEDQIRLVGKIFLDDNWEDKYNSSITSSPIIDKRNGFLSFLFGLVCGAGVLLTSLWILVLITGVVTSGMLIFGLLAVGIISGIYAGGAWRNRKNVRLGIFLIIAVVGWLSLFGIMPNSLKSIFVNAQEARAATEQTAE